MYLNLYKMFGRSCHWTATTTCVDALTTQTHRLIAVTHLGKPNNTSRPSMTLIDSTGQKSADSNFRLRFELSYITRGSLHVVCIFSASLFPTNQFTFKCAAILTVSNNLNLLNQITTGSWWKLAPVNATNVPAARLHQVHPPSRQTLEAERH